MQQQYNPQINAPKSSAEVFATINPNVANRIIALFEDLITSSMRTNNPNLEHFFKRTSKLLNLEQQIALNGLKDILTVDSKLDVIQSLGELAEKFLVHVGVGVSLQVSILADALRVQYQILKINQQSIQFKKVYGDEGFYLAKGKRHSGNLPDQVAFAIGQFVLVNEDAVINDSKNYYQILPKLIAAKNFFPQVLDHLIKQEMMLATKYAEVICLPAICSEEEHHARDHLFAKLITAKTEAPTHPEILESILKSDSTIRALIPLDAKNLESITVMLHASVMEYAAKLGAVIDVMEKSLSAGEEMQAVISFYNYFAEMEMFYEFSKKGISDTYNYQSVYFLCGRHVFSGLADLGIQDYQDLYQKVQFDPIRGLTLLHNLYALDFYSHQERLELLS